MSGLRPPASSPSAKDESLIVTAWSVAPAGRRISDPAGPRTFPPATPTAVVPSGATYSVRSKVVWFPCGSVTVTHRRSSIEARSSASTGRAPTVALRAEPTLAFRSRIRVPEGRAPAGTRIVTIPSTG
jgi:hypothetical protein